LQNLDRIQKVQKTPFVNRGREAGVGLDCWGMVIYVCGGYNISIPDFTIDAFLSPLIHNSYIEQTSDKFVSVVEDELREGDIVALAIDPRLPKIVQHFGVYIGDGKFIHTLAKTGPIICTLHEGLWERLIKGFYRWKGDDSCQN
jgi:cell wall-associated NlpC family hydrolase